MQKKSFLKGAFTLGISGLIVKVIGILYRIPLANIIGTEGAGIYQKAYPFYTLLLMLSTAGLPPAISKLVAQNTAIGDRAGARKILRVSLVMLGTFGLVSAFILYFFSYDFAVMADDPLSQIAISFIAPAVFFVTLMAAIRGYFQGLQNMFPTAMTQMVEQIGKVIFGLSLATYLNPRGIEYGAAGAVLGVMIAEFLAMAAVFIYYLIKRPRVSHHEKTELKVYDILKQILNLSIPILIGASVMPIVQLSDSLLITVRLQDIGYTESTARSVYGIFSGFINPLVNVPGTVALAFCVSILPVISAAMSMDSMDVVRHNTKIGLKMATMVGIPSAIGLGVLASPIMDLLYGNTLTPDEVILAGNLLLLISGGVVFLCILQTMNGVLQGLGRVMIPVAALFLGAAVKIILNFILIGIPSINIYGAPISTFACYAVASILDIIMVKKYTNVKFVVMDDVVRPLLASIFMGAAAWGMYALLSGRVGSSVATLAGVFIGLIVFVICIPLFNVLSRNEILALPGGKKIIKAYELFSKKV
jgi:stage V sporulation protein B